MSSEQKEVSEFGEYKIVELLGPDIGPRRYFGEMSGQVVTKRYPSIEAVRTELEMLSIRRKVKSSKWLAPQGAIVLSPVNLILYPLGRALLLALTLGRYPKEKHNVVFVTFFPWLFVLLSLSALALIRQ